MITTFQLLDILHFRVSDEADEPDWVPLRTFQDITLASLCISYLESEGIRTFISNAHLTQVLPGIEKLVVYVPANQRGKAIALIEGFELKSDQQESYLLQKRPNWVKRVWWWILLAIAIGLLLLQVFMEKYNGQLTW